ncbi:hypothetical protein [Chitinolyticbacter meiyuanensis]|uniref:hypothetical protein n=1 Tax=Chitinolyticbacter meiyuanensis TaxID=682798 RepID=UPI0011E5CA19|nr:hypothetical protein [Chitinolyticbacter meiyuanensis]
MNKQTLPHQRAALVGNGLDIGHWRRAIVAGNRVHAAGDTDSARRAYLYALSLAQGLLSHGEDADEAVAALVVTHHNLADLYLASRRAELAADHLCAVHRQLLTLADGGAPALLAAARMHLRRTRMELLRFLAEHGSHAHVEATLALPFPAAWLH